MAALMLKDAILCFSCGKEMLPADFDREYIFTEAPKMAAKGEDWVTAMLPQNDPDSCKAGRKERSQN